MLFGVGPGDEGSGLEFGCLRCTQHLCLCRGGGGMLVGSVCVQRPLANEEAVDGMAVLLRRVAARAEHSNRVTGRAGTAGGRP